MNHSAIASESEPKSGSSGLILYLIYLIALEWNVFIMQKDGMEEYVIKPHWEKTLNLWDSYELSFALVDCSLFLISFIGHNFARHMANSDHFCSWFL